MTILISPTGTPIRVRLLLHGLAIVIRLSERRATLLNPWCECITQFLSNLEEFGGDHVAYREFTASDNLPQQVLNELTVLRRPPPSLVVGDILGPHRKPDERLETCHCEVKFSPLLEL